jgi:hypothetical protein
MDRVPEIGGEMKSFLSLGEHFLGEKRKGINK